MKNGLGVRIGTLVLGLWVSLSYAGEVTVGKEARDDRVQVYGPPTRYMQDYQRLVTARVKPPEEPQNQIPQQPVTKQAYLEWCERSGHLERDLKNRDHSVYGPRHALPSLAKYVASGDKQYGESVKEMLRNFAKWLKTETDKSGMNSQYMHEPAALGIELRYLRKGGLILPEDEA